MSSVVQNLVERHLVRWPSDIPLGGIQYEVMGGSVSYGVSGDASDVDLVGFCIPRKEELFPHLKGEIPGFGRQKKRFEQFQEHHISDVESNRRYDIVVYNIVKFFSLCMENNPNLLDSLFVPLECVLYSSRVGQMVRESRRLFLHKGCWHKFKGYAYSQLHKLDAKNLKVDGVLATRSGDRTSIQGNCKAAYHVVRLMLEVEQILAEGDLDIRKHREQLKAIRRGDISLSQIKVLFSQKEKDLEALYVNSTVIPYTPKEDEIKQLLLNCLEEYYGSLKEMVVPVDKLTQTLRLIAELALRVIQ
jgi:predicted nucleotidyltransferase